MFIILRRADVFAGTSSSSQSSSFLLLFLVSVAGRSSYRLIPAELEVSPPLAEKYKKKCYFVHLKKLRQEVDSIFCITRWRKIAKQVVHFDFCEAALDWSADFENLNSQDAFHTIQNKMADRGLLIYYLRTSSNLP